MRVPLFICHANCCRSVMAKYLYEHMVPGATALSAGVEAGDEINDRAAAMLRAWGIDPSGHRPTQLDRSLCDRADGIFLMGPYYVFRLVTEYGADLADKAYLFSDPFNHPGSFHDNAHLVFDPSFDERPVTELIREFTWFRDRVLQIHKALEHDPDSLVPATRYLDLLQV